MLNIFIIEKTIKISLYQKKIFQISNTKINKYIKKYYCLLNKLAINIFSSLIKSFNTKIIIKFYKYMKCYVLLAQIYCTDIKKYNEISMWSSHMTHARDCTTSKVNTTPPCLYHNSYHCHQAPDNCHQVLGSK